LTTAMITRSRASYVSALDPSCPVKSEEPPIVVMTTAHESALRLQERVSCPVVHVPEAIDIGLFRAEIPLHQRQIHLLELGRRWDAWHEAVLPTTRSGGLRHVFEPSKGHLVFSNREALVDGLSQSAISVCFPSNLTHPERSGSIETLTQRYLESMASGCLIVGHAPKELVDILGYNPLIESDPDDAADIVSHILKNLTDYQALVDKNRNSMVQICDNRHRAERIMEIVRTARPARERRT